MQEISHHATRGGCFAFEGACGTGKTLAALSPLLALCEESRSPLSQVFVVTPVKQQLRQFLTECQTINDHRSHGTTPVKATALVGKTDLKPYSRPDIQNQIPISNPDLATLYERTAELVSRDSDISIPDIDGDLRSDAGNLWYSTDRIEYILTYAREQVEIQTVERPREEVGDPVNNPNIPADYTTTTRHETEYIQWEESTALTVGGFESPYPRSPVFVEDLVPEDVRADLDDEHRGPIDPFQVGHLATAGDLPFGFSDAQHWTLDRHTLLREAIPRGIDPYAALRSLVHAADVVIGTYNYVFQPGIRGYTVGKLGLIDERTALVVDEAHNLPPQVRDHYTVGVDYNELYWMYEDVQIILDYIDYGAPREDSDSEDGLEFAPTTREIARSALEETDLTRAHYDTLAAVLHFLSAPFIPQHVEQQLDTRVPAWREKLRDGEELTLDTPFTISLQDDHTDRLHDSLEAQYSKIRDERTTESSLSFETFCSSLSDIASTTPTLASVLPEEGFRRVSRAATFLDGWLQGNDTGYARQLEVTACNPDLDDEAVPSWQDYLSPRLRLINCIPASQLAANFSDFRTTVLMSATLEPLNIYRNEVGFDILANNDIETGMATYESPYPEENQALLVGDLPEYTSQNRGTVPQKQLDTNPVETGPEDLVERRTHSTANKQTDTEESGQSATTEGTEDGITTDTDEDTASTQDTGESDNKPDDDPLPAPAVVVDAPMTKTRQQYADTLVNILVATEGNVLIAMPSYDEVDWAALYLRGHTNVSRSVIRDRSGTDTVSDRLRNEFFEGGPKVLVANIHGTLVEGVDYKGDKLTTAVVVGIPLSPPTSEIKAAEDAYERHFDGQSGFEYVRATPAVRQARQTLGRVIRQTDDVGVKILLDGRYTSSHQRSVNHLLADRDRDQARILDADALADSIDLFWRRHR